jgi:hypothetical protein
VGVVGAVVVPVFVKKRKHKHNTATGFPVFRRAKAGDRTLREMQWQQWNLPNQEFFWPARLFVQLSTMRKPLQRRGENARKSTEI